MRAQRSIFFSIVPATLALIAASPAGAQLPYPELRSVFPPGAGAGETVEVTIAGSELEETSELLFTHPGIKSEPVRKAATEFQPERPEPHRFRITVAPEVPAGTYEVHARTPLGLTAPRSFAIGTLPETVHAGDNSNPATPMPLPLGTVVNAHTDPDAIDYYRIELKQGQSVLIQCRGEPIDSRLDATLVLMDSKGRELMRDRDSLGRDAVLDFTAPEDGSFIVEVFDFTYRGGNEYSYRLLASTAPHLDFIDPPAGQPGTTGKFKIYGRNLPGGSEGEGVKLGRHELQSIEVEISLAAATQPGLVVRPVQAALTAGMEYRLAAGGASSNALRIGFATEPIVAETEGEADQAVTPPCEIHGRFDRRSDLDRYRFEAKKDAAVWIECIGGRIRSGIDPLVIVERITRDEKGNEQVAEVASSDDSGGNPGGRRFPVPTHDPFLRFTPKEDGTHRITILNQSNLSGPAALYRLIIRQAAPGFELIATPSHALQVDKQIRRTPVALRPGGTAVYEILALRTGGFDGEITVAAEGLPPGVTCPPLKIPKGQSSGRLIVTSTEDAAAWAGFITIKGTGGNLARAARAGTISWSVSNWEQDYAKPRLSSRIPLSVCGGEKPPLIVQSPGAQRFEVDLDGKLELPVKLIKNVATKGDMIVQPAGLPYTKNAPQVKIKQADSEGKLTITFKKTNEFPITPGEWQVALRAEGTVKHRHNPAAAERAEADRKRIEELEKQLLEEARQAQAAVDPARKAVQEAEKNRNSASPEAKAGLEGKVNEARKQLEAAETAAKATAEKAKRATTEKNSATQRVKQANERAKEKDVKHATYSLPITVVVKAPPPKEEGK